MIINKINLVSFSGNSTGFANVPYLDKKYTTQENRGKTVAILGSSKQTDAILNSMDLCSKTTKDLIKSGHNIVTGCGSNGIMGAAYDSAKTYSKKDTEKGQPIQNLAIVMEPAWGDEDLENCIPIGKAKSEEERINKFTKTADTFVIFPGSATTIQEAVSLIQKNEYKSKDQPAKKIILVGKEFFSGLEKQYNKLYESKLLRSDPENLFSIVDTEEEILDAISK